MSSSHLFPADTTRRVFIGSAGALCGVLTAQAARAAEGERVKEEHEEHEEEEISPAEDLMREHGVLKRILLVYEEGITRLNKNGDVDLALFKDAASIIRSFIEDYHEKLEEDFLFPRFTKANEETALVATLQKQHQAGRILTDRILKITGQSKLGGAEEQRALAQDLHLFVRMYGPHEAREDTVLFPALRKIVTPEEYGALGEDFEKKEHELFGEGGFEEMVNRVAAIEKGLGIYELDQFTPKPAA